MIKKKTILPGFFISYSSREPYLQVLFLCLWIVFKDKFRMQRTPSLLQSGASQLQQITDLISDCEFAVVALDGLRANVVFEYGLLRALNKPVIVLKEKNARVDIQSYFDTPNLQVPEIKLSVDSHLSNVKDINYAEWDRLDPQASLEVIVSEYEKKRSAIPSYSSILIPKLWK